MAEQVVKMVIEVDLQCCRCYKKIKKILSEIPEVKDPIFDEEQNTVTITVVCCCPDKVRQKIYCKGGDIICCIKIIIPSEDKSTQTKPPATKDGSTQTKPPATKDGSTQTKPPATKDESTQTTKPCPGKHCTPMPVLGYPSYGIGWGSICPPCHNGGCSWFSPCNCHCGKPPVCDDGFGRPPMCRDGCGSPAPECRWWTPSPSRCCDRCNDGDDSPPWTPCSCDGGRPPVCTNAGYKCDPWYSC